MRDAFRDGIMPALQTALEDKMDSGFGWRKHAVETAGLGRSLVSSPNCSFMLVRQGSGES
jgi:hypothetical protein